MTHFNIRPKLEAAVCLSSLLLAFGCSGGAQSGENSAASAETTDDTAQAVAANFKAEDRDECDQDDCTGSGDYDEDDDMDDQSDDTDDGDYDEDDDMDDQGDDTDDGDDQGDAPVADAGAPASAVDASLGSCGSSSPTVDAAGGG